MSKTFTPEVEKYIAEMEATMEKRIADAKAEGIIEARYDIFCEQRAKLKLCIKSCRNTEYLFIPPTFGY